MNKTFKDIQEEYLQDIIWDEFNAPSILQKTSSLIVKYQNYMYKALNNIELITESLGAKYQELYLEYKLGGDIILKDSEIKVFIETNKEYLKLKSANNKLQNQINYYEDCIKNINQLRWDIKNWLDIRKFQEGIV